MTTVSAIITSFNRVEFLPLAIESVLRQSHAVSEIIVVDDASEQDVQACIEPYKDRVQLHISERNMGANHSRNVGVAVATGDYVAFLDDDDVWHPEKTKTQLDAIGDAPICLCGFDFVDDTTIKVLDTTEVETNTLRMGNSYCGASGIFGRRTVFVGFKFDESLPNAQDWDIYVRIIQSHRIPYVPQALFARRRGGHESITKKAKTSDIQQIIQRTAAIEKHRKWLGKYYYFRMASSILAFIGQKKNKIEILLTSLRKAGFYGTGWWLISKIYRYIQN